MPDRIQDLTLDERKELEDLREKVAVFEDIVRCLPIGLIFVDAEDRVTMANPIGAEIRCVGDRLGASVAECHPRGTHGTLEKVLERFKTEEKLQDHPIVLERMHRYEVTYSRVSKPDGDYRGVLWLSHDISRRKKLERELMHAERLAGLGRMAAKVAHDIKNPLNAIQGAAHYLRQERGNEEYFEEMTSIIKEQVGRIATLVNHLSELTRPFELTLGPVDLGELVTDHLKGCALNHPDCKWTLRVEESVGGPVRVDRTLIERLVCNAVENAYLSMKNGGTLDVRIQSVHREDGGWVEIEFEDDGPGFPPEVLQNRFQPFLTTRENGTGLGLTIMREICLLHGGDLFIDNLPTGALVRARLSTG